MQKAVEINNYITRGTVEANIEYANKHKSYFSLVKFGYNVDLDDAYTFKDLIGFIHLFTDFSPILQHENDTFLIFFKDTKIHQAKALINKMDYQIKNRFSFELKNIGITVNHTEDNYKKLLDRVDKYYVMSKLSTKKRVFYGTVEFDYYDTMDSGKVLKRIFDKSSKITLHNLFKGIPINEKTKVLDFTDGIIQLKINSTKIPFYKNEKFTYIEHDLIPDIIKARILKIEEKNALMVLGNLEFLKSSPVERSDIRVEPNNKIIASLTNGPKKIIEGYITTISENSLSLYVPDSKLEILLRENLFGKEMEINFQIMNEKNFLTPIKTKTYLFSIVNNKVVLNIMPNSTTKAKIKNYISSRQNEILNLLKKELIENKNK